MRSTIILLAMVTTILAACGGGKKDSQGDPRSVAEAIFDAAQS